MTKTLRKSFIIPALLVIIMACMFICADSAQAATTYAKGYVAYGKDPVVIGGHTFAIEDFKLCVTPAGETEQKEIFDLRSDDANICVVGNKVYFQDSPFVMSSDKTTYIRCYDITTGSCKSIVKRTNGCFLVSANATTVAYHETSATNRDLKYLRIYNLADKKVEKTIKGVYYSNAKNGRYIYTNMDTIWKVYDMETKVSRTICKNLDLSNSFDIGSKKLYYSYTLSDGRHAIYTASYSGTNKTKLCVLPKDIAVDTISSKYVFYRTTSGKNIRYSISTGNKKSYADYWDYAAAYADCQKNCA